MPATRYGLYIAIREKKKKKTLKKPLIASVQDVSEEFDVAINLIYHLLNQAATSDGSDAE